MVIRKVLSRNDVGDTGSHQAGIVVSKQTDILAFFPRLDGTIRNPDREMSFTGDDGTIWVFRFVYYNGELFGGTRNEYRLTHVTEFIRRHELRPGDVFELSRSAQGYQVYSQRMKEPIEGGGWTSELSDGEAAEGEGRQKLMLVKRYERSRLNRKLCLDIHGTRCKVCDLDFEEEYGPIGAGFVHVHHVVPVSQLDESYELDLETDLLPVCPNCHAMLHREDPPLSLEELGLRRERVRRGGD